MRTFESKASITLAHRFWLEIVLAATATNQLAKRPTPVSVSATAQKGLHLP